MSDARRISPEQIEEAIATLAEFYQKGTITDDQFFKGMVNIAYEYAVRGEITKTVSVLAKCSSTYFRTTLKEQMLIDAEFFEVASYLADFLVENNVVQPDSSVRPTQGPAQA